MKGVLEMPTRRVMVTTVIVLGLFAAACGGTKAKAEIPVYTIGATEPSAGKFAFSFPPAIKGGVITVRLQNNGNELHDLQLAKAVPGHTLDDLLKQVTSEEAPLEQWVEAAGGVGGVGAGESAQATLDLKPGTYWYFCTESSGEGDNEVAHASNGMAGEVTLEGESGAVMPPASATIVAADYSLTPSGLKAGSNTVGFRNDGKQLHHAVLFPLQPGKTLEDAKNFLASEGGAEPPGPPPVDFEKGLATAVINPGQRVIVTLDLQAATNYVLLCFLPDKGTAGPPHVAKGMLAEARIS